MHLHISRKTQLSMWIWVLFWFKHWWEQSQSYHFDIVKEVSCQSLIGHWAESETTFPFQSRAACFLSNLSVIATVVSLKNTTVDKTKKGPKCEA